MIVRDLLDRRIHLDSLFWGLGPHSRDRRLATDDRGGSVVMTVEAVHTRECPFWRQGKRHGPCSCGAADAWKKVYPTSEEAASST